MTPRPPRIHMSVPHMGPNEEGFVHEAFATNWMSTVGPHLSAFESEFSARLGLPSVALGSGTAAIHLGLRLLGVGPGDEVFVPTLTFIASVNPVRYLGAKSVFLDSDTATWNLDPQRLAEALKARAARNALPKAVMVVHLYGQCADMDPILEVCARYGVPILEDAAEALGADYRGKPAGSMGVVSAFSFNGNKIITTTGGGMLAAKDPAWVDKARFWSTQAKDPGIAYEHTDFGYNYRLSNVLAGIGRGQLQVLEQRVQQRRAVFARYVSAFAELPGFTPMPEASFGTSTHWLSVFLVDEAKAGVSRDGILTALEAQNIEARPVWKPMHLQPINSALEYLGGGVAERLFQEGICLPSSSSLSEGRPGPGHLRGASRGGWAQKVERRLSKRFTSSESWFVLADSGLSFRQWIISPLRAALMLVLDGCIAALSLSFAMLLRFDWHAIPPAQWSGFRFGLPVLILIRVALSYASGMYRWSFRMSGLHEAIRVAATVVAGSLAYVTVLVFFKEMRPPRSVAALEFFFTTALMLGYRFAPRASGNWVRRIARPRLTDTLRRTLIVGAGSAGDLLLRDLDRSDSHTYRVVGLVDDDPNKLRMSLGGRPVLGKISDLPTLVARHHIQDVLIAIPRLPGARVREILASCAQSKVSFKIIPASFTYLDEKVTAAMLHELSPEDLLPRDPITFDHQEIRALIGGRRVMVTGAGGSIGSEIARQVASHSPDELVLVDMNENELYFLVRQLQEEHPHLRVHALVADIRDGAQLMHLGQKFKPQDVFHAAAHKHVPLMEDMPAEAVKNNVFGTINVATMADACGAERFIFISTDKAVRPTSVMGASKRVAEIAVRDFAKRSKTRFTSVRFGNVLGSAGSVVPLFKLQIERGGPVTVTHPDCTRFFMIIPEAVGLVMLAGLGNYGELCILDMGEAIRIADLAANMITMSGRVPNVDINIVFTGLRPGEKLYEELFTEEEEESQVVRNKIMVAKSVPAPKELARWLEELHHAAMSNDKEAIIGAFRAIVPSYQPANAKQISTPSLKLVKNDVQSA